jgi:hypothetical protein
MCVCMYRNEDSVSDNLEDRDGDRKMILNSISKEIDFSVVGQVLELVHGRVEW